MTDRGDPGRNPRAQEIFGEVPAWERDVPNLRREPPPDSAERADLSLPENPREAIKLHVVWNSPDRPDEQHTGTVLGFTPGERRGEDMFIIRGTDHSVTSGITRDRIRQVSPSENARPKPEGPPTADAPDTSVPDTPEKAADAIGMKVRWADPDNPEIEHEGEVVGNVYKSGPDGDTPLYTVRGPGGKKGKIYNGLLAETLQRVPKTETGTGEGGPGREATEDTAEESETVEEKTAETPTEENDTPLEQALSALYQAENVQDMVGVLANANIPDTEKELLRERARNLYENMETDTPEDTRQQVLDYLALPLEQRVEMRSIHPDDEAVRLFAFADMVDGVRRQLPNKRKAIQAVELFERDVDSRMRRAVEIAEEAAYRIAAYNGAGPELVEAYAETLEKVLDHCEWMHGRAERRGDKKDAAEQQSFIETRTVRLIALRQYAAGRAPLREEDRQFLEGWVEQARDRVPEPTLDTILRLGIDDVERTYGTLDARAVKAALPAELLRKIVRVADSGEVHVHNGTYRPAADHEVRIARHLLRSLSPDAVRGLEEGAEPEYVESVGTMLGSDKDLVSPEVLADAAHHRGSPPPENPQAAAAEHYTLPQLADPFENPPGDPTELQRAYANAIAIVNQTAGEFPEVGKAQIDAINLKAHELRERHAFYQLQERFRQAREAGGRIPRRVKRQAIREYRRRSRTDLPNDLWRGYAASAIYAERANGAATEGEIRSYYPPGASAEGAVRQLWRKQRLEQIAS